MPTFGKLLGRSKTKEDKKEDKHSNYQPIQYKQSGTSSTTSKVASSPAPSKDTAPVTSTPEPTVKGPANGDADKANMNASLADPAGGAVDSKTQPRQTKGKYTLTDFKIERTLGTGSFGRVHLVQSKHNQRYYAVKVLKKQQVVKMKQIEHTNDERKMLQRCKHPFLITLWGTFQDSKNLYMVMDFIEGGELFSLLRKSQVSEEQPTLKLRLILASASRIL